MLTFNQKLKLLLAVISLDAIFLANNPVLAAETAVDHAADTHQAHHNQADWPGLYNGFLPCADCIGLKTSLALNKNSSYVLIYQYVGKSPRDYVEKGKFTLGDNSDSVVLTSRDGNTVRHYAVGKDILIELDKAGNRMTGKDADRYILRRTDMTSAEPDSHAGH